MEFRAEHQVRPRAITRRLGAPLSVPAPGGFSADRVTSVLTARSRGKQSHSAHRVNWEGTLLNQRAGIPRRSRRTIAPSLEPLNARQLLNASSLHSRAEPLLLAAHRMAVRRSRPPPQHPGRYSRAIKTAPTEPQPHPAQLPPGRPKNTPEAKRLYRRAKSIQRRVTELFDPRHLFVRHYLTPGQRSKVQSLCVETLSSGRSAQLSTRFIGYSTCGDEQTRPWQNWRGCATACAATEVLGKV
jgi:hypothetical protein